MAYTNEQSIYEFDDYQECLRHLVELRKIAGLPFSYRWFSQKAGFRSPNYLHLVLSKQRHLSEDAVEKVISIFRLNALQAQYFRELVDFNKEKTLSQRAVKAERLLQIRAAAQTRTLNDNQMEYYLNWRNIAIRECLSMHGEGLTVAELAKCLRPPMKVNEVAECLKALENLGLVVQNDNDSWRAQKCNVTSGDRVSSSALVKYHLEMIDRAKESLDRFGPEARDITNLSVPVSNANFEKIRGMIQVLRQEILNLSEADPFPEQVTQINFQIFPVAVKKDSL